MKSKGKQAHSAMSAELLMLFRDVYEDEAECKAAVIDAKKALAFVRQDIYFKEKFNECI